MSIERQRRSHDEYRSGVPSIEGVAGATQGRSCSGGGDA